ncbi:MAG TPA: type 2 lanthipeptide synthetase LanM family protein [Xanthobacteraceae bacterium]|nr:type 2 lanthipeptide synthetase LanM family protein [Xanthobacteraceae bacterium]
MDAFYKGLWSYGATIDELLSTPFEPGPGPQASPDLAARRLAAWCRASAADDEALFARRLERDGWSLPELRERLGIARPGGAGRVAALFDDAAWIEAALQDGAAAAPTRAGAAAGEACAFQELLLPLVAQAEKRLCGGVEAAAAGNLNEAARTGLSLDLLQRLSALAAPALYDRFAKARNSGTGYRQFVATMTAGGFRALFEAKPVLLRLLATLVRQWIDTAGELIGRLATDLPAIRHELLRSDAGGRVDSIGVGLSDPHNFGRSVQVIHFEDGARVVYKPKDLRLDVAWHALIERLNRAGPPVTLKAVRAIAQDGYGWTEFIDHVGCADETGCARFFRRAGAWLALLHVFVATDMHQENMIATGEHPVPVDLETILQPAAEEHKIQDPEGEAFNAAIDIIANSVMTVGLLPAYGRGVDNSVFAMGGMTADWGARSVIKWNDVNSDAMRPARAQEPGTTNTNLPHVDGRHAKFADHLNGFVAGFADYAAFLRRQTQNGNANFLLTGFAGVPVRKIVRPTRFYYMLLQRLKDHRSMDDGAVWSAQADFVARLAEWDNQSDPLWPLHRAERTALLSLNVPHFLVASDGDEITDTTGVSVHTAATPGLARARARLAGLDDREIAWQVEVIRENTNSIAPSQPEPPRRQAARDGIETTTVPASEAFRAEADRIAAELSRYAIRRGPGAAWIGLDWLGDSEVFQLVCLGPDLYNGASGIALFLAAHAAATGDKASGELARASIAQLRKNLKSRNAPRLARTLGIGAATGLGSIVYAFAAMAKLLGSRDLLADALAVTELFTDALIDADKQLDVMGGSAGAVLALLRVYRDSRSAAVLGRAVKCGEHLLAQRRVGTDGRRIWVGQGLGANALARGLNGMSHGAAGFAYALSSLAAAAGREDFAAAAAECVAFEDASYDAERHNWPDWRGAGAPTWPCQWCHGAPGIGLARLGMERFGAGRDHNANRLTTDIRNAASGVAQAAAGGLDTLCCGTLGRIEFICEAANTLERGDLRELAAQRLAAVLTQAAAAGDYRWNSGKRQFNLGLFRGLSGVGYTLLRQARSPDDTISLPNVLIWE